MKIVIYLLMVVALAGTEAPALAESLTLSGVITDAYSHSPIAQAAVSVVGGRAIHDEIADSNGIFVLTFVETVKPGDIIRLRVQMTGYQTYDENVVVPSGGKLPKPISLRKSSAVGSHKAASNSAGAEGVSGHSLPNASLPTPMAQDCASGANCAQSIGQTGGITAGKVEINTVPTPPNISWTAEPLAPGVYPKAKGWSIGADPEQQEKQRLQKNNPGALITLTIDKPWTNAQFGAICDVPCKTIEAITMDGTSAIGELQGAPNIVVVGVQMPGTLPANAPIRWEIRSQSTDPLTILAVKRNIQRENPNAEVNGNINTGPCSNVQVGNNNQSTVNCPPQPKPLVRCAGDEASIVVCNSDGTQLHGNKVFGGSPTSILLNSSDHAVLSENEYHQIPGHLAEVYNRGMWLSDDCHRKKNGVSYKSKNVNTDEDLRQAIVRWKNNVLPALEVKDTKAWIDAFGKELDLGNGVLEDYCRDVDYEGSRMSMLRKIRE